MAQNTSVPREIYSGREVAKPQNTARQWIQEGLHNVRVSKKDATEAERKMRGELFTKWNEKVELMEAQGIETKNILSFINHMKTCYEGVTDQFAEQMKGIKFMDKWNKKLIEFDFVTKKNLKQGEPSKANYCLAAFGKNEKGDKVDCVYLLYKLDFELAPKRVVTTTKHSSLFGYFTWTEQHVHEESRTLGMDSIQMMKNFFRYKALKGFFNEGVIERINIVPSLDDI